MTSAKLAAAIQNRFLTKFRYIDRGKDDLLVLIPGWASDYRIFATLNLEFNYLIPLGFSPFTFEKDLLGVLREDNIKKISLFGWSLGGFVGAEFAAKYSHLVDKLILVSIRECYNSKELVELSKRLKRGKEACLYKFYTQCFVQQAGMCWFRKNLLKEYCAKFDLSYLLDCLDYLEQAKMNPGLLSNIEWIKIIHGEDDRIAPIREAIKIKKSLPQAKFISIEKAGHGPFLKESFSRYI